MKRLLPYLMSAAVFTLSIAQAGARQPNVVVILSDDAGYADFSMQGSKEFATPRIDSIAKNGIRFSNGYVSGAVCSPTRAGLLTGRYQQRFGHEFNIPPALSETNGLNLEETTIAQVMKSAGYRTVALGKWHLGYAQKFHPLERGFDDYYGFLQGARSYWPLPNSGKLNALLRDREKQPENFQYMTDELGREAVGYIEKHKARPFFMYLAFNAVHAPMHALEADKEKLPVKMPARRRTLGAMTLAMDRAVGMVLDALDKNDISQDTIVFFLNDNGGATTNASSNAPLRGHKGQMWEGGIRVPFAVQWPGKLPRGVVYKSPVISLDIFPTAMAAAGVEKSSGKPLDGVNLLPFLQGGKGAPHEVLYWKSGPNWAVRQGDFKAIMQDDAAKPALFNLVDDIAEKNDISTNNPDRVRELSALYEIWKQTHIPTPWAGKRAGKEAVTDEE